MTSDTKTAVLNALENSAYSFRTVEGLAKELDLAPAYVLKVIEANEGVIRRSPVPDIRGRTLYTLRDRASERRGPMTKSAFVEQDYLEGLRANLEKQFIRQGFRTLGQFERFFYDPTIEDEPLRPPYSGLACDNIRTALRSLEYETEYGDRYDEELVQVVLRFQFDCGHASRDGFVGPGTRRLLTYRLFDRGGRDMFLGMADPTEHKSYVKYGHYFRDPGVGDGLLKPTISGIACANIRRALQLLDFEIGRGDVCNEHLARTVLQFQTKYNHRSRDGFFGPGTRKLLVIVLLEEVGEDAFEGFQNPEQDSADRVIQSRQEQVDVSCLQDFIRPHFNMEELKSLCMNLNVDYEEFPAVKTPMVRELVLWFKRREMLYKLKDVIGELRPNIILDC